MFCLQFQSYLECRNASHELCGRWTFHQEEKASGVWAIKKIYYIFFSLSMKGEVWWLKGLWKVFNFVLMFMKQAWKWMKKIGIMPCKTASNRVTTTQRNDLTSRWPLALRTCNLVLRWIKCRQITNQIVFLYMFTAQQRLFFRLCVLVALDSRCLQILQ